MGAKSTIGTMLNKEAGTGKAGESASSRPFYEAHELTREPPRIKDGNRKGAGCCDGRQAKEVAKSPLQNDLCERNGACQGLIVY